MAIKTSMPFLYLVCTLETIRRRIPKIYICDKHENISYMWPDKVPTKFTADVIIFCYLVPPQPHKKMKNGLVVHVKTINKKFKPYFQLSNILKFAGAQ